MNVSSANFADYITTLQGSPNRLSVRLNSTQADGHSHTLSELPPEPCLMPPITPDSAQGIPTEPIYLSDSDLYPDALRHRRHVSASSIRLRTLPSLRRGERKKTAVLERKRNSVMQQALSRGTVAPGQPSKVWRVRDGKFLQTEWKGPVALEACFSLRCNLSDIRGLSRSCKELLLASVPENYELFYLTGA